MPPYNDHHSQPDDALGVDGTLAGRVAALEGAVRRLREELSMEVRTRRLVVVDGDGRERVVAGSEDTWNYLRVSARSRPDDVDCAAEVELYACDETGRQPTDAGLSVALDGIVVRRVNALH